MRLLTQSLIVSMFMAGFGCSSQNFSAGTNGVNKSKDAKPCVKTKTKDCVLPDPNGTETVPMNPAMEHEAVFAVKNLSCALCHAKIDSNVISDFASKSDKTSAAHALAQIIYLAQAKDSRPGSHSITGKFIVPEGDTYVETSAAAGNVAACSWAGLGKTSLNYVPVSLIDSLNKCVKSVFTWGNSAEAFVTRKSVEIQPVNSADQIKNLADAAALASAGFAAVGSGKISGLAKNSTGGVSGTGTITCDGAVVVAAPLILKNTSVQTTKGCRIYSTASIFVFGTMTVSGPAETANIQLMSPVFVGFDISSADAAARINHDVNKLYSYSIGASSAVSARIGGDAAKVGAQTGGAGSATYAKVAASAPIVYSRSSGQFSGVIIAEQFIGRIGSLSFVFDPVFKKGPSTPALFPEITQTMVTVSGE